TAVGMVKGIHRHAADGGTLAPPAALASLADVLVFVLDIANLANRRVTKDGDPPHLTRRHPDLGVVALAGQQLRGHPRRADDLSAASALELDVVHRAAERDAAQRQGVAWLDVGLRSADHRVADGEPDRRQDVALLAIGISEE